MLLAFISITWLVVTLINLIIKVFARGLYFSEGKSSEQ